MIVGSRVARSSRNRVYPAGILLGAVLTHLASEFFAMGADADAHVVLSPRHVYLAIAALACCALIVWEIRCLAQRSSGHRDFKRLISNELARLPMGGGWRFYFLTASLQFAVGVGSALGEGCLFCGHDVIAGILGALATAVLLALLGRLVAARLPNLAAGFAVIFLPIADQSPRIARQWARFAWSPRLIFCSPQLANRPPPLLS